MRIDSVIIERSDGSEHCGILFYEHDASEAYLPWTIDLQDPQRIVLKLFPPDADSNLAVVQSHYETMAGAIVDRVMKRPH